MDIKQGALQLEGLGHPLGPLANTPYMSGSTYCPRTIDDLPASLLAIHYVLTKSPTSELFLSAYFESRFVL
jgi:hypothetical protein